MKELELLAELIYEFVPYENWPDRAQDLAIANDAGTPEVYIRCVYGYLKELATDYIEFCESVVLPPYEG